MRVIHRLVAVIGFFGALLIGILGGFRGDLGGLALLIPLIVAAIVIYPITWICAGFRA